MFIKMLNIVLTHSECLIVMNTENSKYFECLINVGAPDLLHFNLGD